MLGVQEIALGRADVVVAGGAENMTQVPFYLKRMRTGYRLGDGKLIDGMYDDGFHCRLADQLMGRTAETLAEQYVLSRTEQDQFALESQQKAGKTAPSSMSRQNSIDDRISTDDGVSSGITAEEVLRLYIEAFSQQHS